MYFKLYVLSFKEHKHTILYEYTFASGGLNFMLAIKL